MNTVLELIREFSALNDAKVRRGGTLAAADEKRWGELKSFYDLLMSQSGFSLGDASSYSKADLQTYVTDRARLRVPARIYALVHHDDSCYAAQVVNLSRSGVFISSKVLFEVGSRVELHLANSDGQEDDVVELHADVVWVTENGVAEAALPRGMGLHFGELTPENQDKLDTWVLDILEKRLSTLW
jgi:Tfp pilus assembly protein PilZ